MLGSLTIPLFPLSAVLFRGGYLPLHIFEPRYLRMIKECREADIGFGVVLIREGTEVHSEEKSGMPAIHSVGTLAEIVEVEELPENRLAVMAIGGAKFNVGATWEESDHLMMGEVTFMRDEPTGPVREQDSDLATLLEYLIDVKEVPTAVRRAIDFADERDLSLRLADLLPLHSDDKQKLLQMDSPRVRLTTIRQWSDL